MINVVCSNVFINIRSFGKMKFVYTILSSSAKALHPIGNKIRQELMVIALVPLDPLRSITTPSSTAICLC